MTPPNCTYGPESHPADLIVHYRRNATGHETTWPTCTQHLPTVERSLAAATTVVILRRDPIR